MPDRDDTPVANRAAARHAGAEQRGEPGYVDPDSGLFVLTAGYLRTLGRCCRLGCRHCPWRKGCVGSASVSWDILIQDLPAEAKSVDEIPDDFAPQPLGSRPALIAKIQAAVPTCDFSDPAWGQVVTADYVVEFNMGNAEVVESIMLHIRGGDAAVGLVADILEHLALRAIDVQQGNFFDPAVAGESLAAWRRYRDQVIGPVEA